MEGEMWEGGTIKQESENQERMEMEVECMCVPEKTEMEKVVEARLGSLQQRKDWRRRLFAWVNERNQLQK